MNPDDDGDDFLIAFIARPNVAPGVSRGLGLIEGKSIVQIQIDPFVTHFSVAGFATDGVALMYYDYAHRKQNCKRNSLRS